MNLLLRRWMKILLILIPSVAIASLIRRQIRFEHFLDSLHITFEDFESSYSKALLQAASQKKEVEFDNYPSLASLESKTNIPPTIHYIWFRNLYHNHLDISKIPQAGSDSPDICRDYNPDFTIRIWNATEARALLEQHYAWFLPTYDNYRYPIQRVDAFKYFVLLHYGGIYMDLDIGCRRSLIPLLEYPAWFPDASPLGVNNDLMASRVNHPAIRRMTESLHERDRNLLFPYLTIFWATGPQFTSDILKQWWNDQKEKLYQRGSRKRQSNPDWFYVLPQEFYSERYSFFGHRPGGTWHGTDVAVILWIVNRSWAFLGIAMLVPLSIYCRRVLQYWRIARNRPITDVESYRFINTTNT